MTLIKEARPARMRVVTVPRKRPTAPQRDQGQRLRARESREKSRARESEKAGAGSRSAALPLAHRGHEDGRRAGAKTRGRRRLAYQRNEAGRTGREEEGPGERSARRARRGFSTGMRLVFDPCRAAAAA